MRQPPEFEVPGKARSWFAKWTTSINTMLLIEVSADDARICGVYHESVLLARRSGQNQSCLLIYFGNFLIATTKAEMKETIRGLQKEFQRPSSAFICESRGKRECSRSACAVISTGYL